MTRVAGCVPVLPPLQIKTGIKRAKATMAVKVFSKAAITLDENLVEVIGVHELHPEWG
ncbi:MAG: hypothetical protein U9N47_00775 [Thermodesulfobacteriota bacterium]|nr:hypothetical protein [Thermodesulfobacteriota bacterium]